MPAPTDKTPPAEPATVSFPTVPAQRTPEGGLPPLAGTAAYRQQPDTQVPQQHPYTQVPQQHPTNAPTNLPAPKPKRRARSWIPLGVFAALIVVGLVVAGTVGSGGGSTSTTAAQPGYTQLPEASRSPLSAPTVSRAPAATTPAPVAAPATTQAAAAGTVAQRNAVKKAESYLDYTAFSRTGLITQLEFEGFTKADATYAVDHITVDWTEQADKKAQSYMDYSSFSRSGLIKQLQFEGFTAAQAAHGASAVGL
jgi:hypothetical protein